MIFAVQDKSDLNLPVTQNTDPWHLFRRTLRLLVAENISCISPLVLQQKAETPFSKGCSTAIYVLCVNERKRVNYELRYPYRC